jgi:hypothetical protein
MRKRPGVDARGVEKKTETTYYNRRLQSTPDRGQSQVLSSELGTAEKRIFLS